MSLRAPLSRRTVLRGLGTALALPWLEAMGTRGAWAGPAAKDPPRRLAFLYVPNGVHMPDWTPRALGEGYDLPWILEPLRPHQSGVLVLSGLAHAKANANGDGPGDHAREMATFLTGCQAFKTDGANLRVGVSVDQVVARRLGAETWLPSLEIGLEASAQSGQCDSGYSCAYSSNLSWRSETQPSPKETDPRLVFDRLLGDGDVGASAAARAERRARRASVLDYVREDARRLAGSLGASDRRRLEEYETSVRELERRLDRSAGAAPADFPRPDGMPADFATHARLMADLVVLAFQADLTRVVTFPFGNGGSNRSYPSVGVPQGHHEVSHHAGDASLQERIRRINRFHVEQLAWFLGRLATVKEGDATLLDRSLVVYGSCIGDGNRHNHDDLPLLVAGGGGGTLRSGRHLRFPSGTPVCNLWLSLLDRMEVRLDRFGDATGRLDLS